MSDNHTVYGDNTFHFDINEPVNIKVYLKRSKCHVSVVYHKLQVETLKQSLRDSEQTLKQ